MAGPTIEWLEPKLPDILKNGSGSLGGFAAGEGAPEGSRLELGSADSCSFSGVSSFFFFFPPFALVFVLCLIA